MENFSFNPSIPNQKFGKKIKEVGITNESEDNRPVQKLAKRYNKTEER